MLTRKIIWSLLVALAVLSLALMGCSSKKSTESTIVSSGDPTSVTSYIQLNEGWRVSYTTLEPTVAHFDVEVSDPAVIDGHNGYTIRTTNSTTFEQSYKYLYATNNAIYESYSTNDPGRKILEAPFNIGNSWQVMDLYDNLDDSISVGDADDGGGLQLVGAGDGVYNEMSIVAKESVQALDGQTYANCLKIEWQTGEYSYIYFWYAAGIGLVKTQNVPNSLSASDNNTVTIMSDYQQVTY